MKITRIKEKNRLHTFKDSTQTLGVLTRIYAAELRDKQKSEEPDEVPRFM